MRKLLIVAILSMFLASSLNAEEFVANEPLNKFSTEYMWRICKISSWSETTQWCHFPTDSEEFKKRQKIANWYNDFDTIMRFRMYEEIIWDYGWKKSDLNVGIHETYYEEAAYDDISDHTEAFESYAIRYIKDRERNETRLRSDISDRTLITVSQLANLVAGYKEMDTFRKALVKNWRLDKTDHNGIYLSNIDELHAKIKEIYYPVQIWEENIEKWEKVYFPNVIKFLELKKEWTKFYRDHKNVNPEFLRKFWYTESEINKSSKGEYNNSFTDKANFEEPITQEIWGTILEGNLPKKTISDEIESWNPIEEEQTLWQLNAKKYNRDYDFEYERIDRILTSYFKKQKLRGKTQLDVNKTVNDLIKFIPTRLQQLDEELKEAKTSDQKARAKNFIVIVSILLDTLQNEQY